MFWLKWFKTTDSIDWHDCLLLTSHERDHIPNHRKLDCFFNSVFRHMSQSHHTPGPRTGCSWAVQRLFWTKIVLSRKGPVRRRADFVFPYGARKDLMHALSTKGPLSHISVQATRTFCMHRFSSTQKKNLRTNRYFAFFACTSRVGWHRRLFG